MKALVATLAVVGALVAVGGASIGPAGDGDGAPDPEPAPGISALGRLEPRGGVVRMSGPSGPAPVVRQLLVAEGDRVEMGQLVALLDRYEVAIAEVERLEAELDNANAELARSRRLHRRGVLSDARRDTAELRVVSAAAELRSARARTELLAVRSPLSGEVLEVHTRPGERVHADGIVELGRTDEMVAIAEVYETDIGRVRLGAGASVRSPALPEPLRGEVRRIGRKVGQLDVLEADPVAVADARVVEVEIALDDARADAALTYLQVEVVIER